MGASNSILPELFKYKFNFYPIFFSYPNIVVSGRLPKLVVHFNEDKIFALERMTRLLLQGGDDGGGAAKASVATQTAEAGSADAAEGEGLALFSEWSPEQDVDEASRLLAVQFCVSEMSVELRSQEKSLAELQGRKEENMGFKDE